MERSEQLKIKALEDGNIRSKRTGKKNLISPDMQSMYIIKHH